MWRAGTGLVLALVLIGCPKPVGWKEDATVFVPALGKTMALSALARGEARVALCFFCGCQPCKESGKKLGARLAPEAAIAVMSMPPEEAGPFLKGIGWRGKVALDAPGVLEKRFEAALCPKVVVLDGAGQKLYATVEQAEPLSEASLKAVEKAMRP